MAKPANFKLWFAFGTDPLDLVSLLSEANWTDVSDDFEFAQFTTSNRRTQFDVFAAGRASFVLNNPDRDYDPDYSSGPYFGDIVRNLPCRVTAEHSASRKAVWYGYVRDWRVEYQGGFKSVARVVATDPVGLLARYDLAQITASYAGDTVADRVERVIADEIGFNPAVVTYNAASGVDLDATTFGVNALTYLNGLARSTAGLFYAQPGGGFVFDGKESVATVTRQSTSQDTYSATEFLYDSIRYAGTFDNFRDLVRIADSTGTLHETDNTTANEVPQVLSVSPTEIAHGQDASAVAEFYADLYSTGVNHPTELTFTVAGPDTDLHTEVFNRSLRDRVTVTFDPPGPGSSLSSQVFIDGFSHRVTPSKWDTTLYFSSADAYDDNLAGPPSDWLILNDATAGQLDSNDLGY